MRVTIQMPDDLYELYAKRAKQANVQISSYVSDVLKFFQRADVADRIIIIHKLQRARLEELFAAAILSDDDLVRRVEKILHLGISSVELDFTPGQKAEIRRIAQRNNVPYEEQIRRTVKSMEAQFFSGLPGSF